MRNFQSTNCPGEFPNYTGYIESEVSTLGILFLSIDEQAQQISVKADTRNGTFAGDYFVNLTASFQNDYLNYVRNTDLSFTIRFINVYQPPTFTEKLPRLIEIESGQIYEFQLPQIIDSSLGSVTISI